MSRTIRALIADDEPLARRRVIDLLEEHLNVRVVAEAANGTEAVRLINDQKIDLVFLDIQMPGLSGFEVIDTIGIEQMPPVIFVTAYDEFAIRAFEVHAVDYLLKPFDRERFALAVKRAVRLIGRSGGAKQSSDIDNLLRTVNETNPLPGHLPVRVDGRTIILRIDRIDWLKAEANYVKIFAGRENYLIRSTLASMEKRLQGRRFARVHRSAIVNIEQIAEIEPHFHGDCHIRLRSGARVKLSRRYRSELEPFLK